MRDTLIVGGLAGGFLIGGAEALAAGSAALVRWGLGALGIGGPASQTVGPNLDRVRVLTEEEIALVNAAGKFPTGSNAAAIIRQARSMPGWLKYVQAHQMDLNEGQALSQGPRDHSHFPAGEYLELAKAFIASGGH